MPEKPIVFSICEWGRNKPWRWGAEAGNLWRTTPDIMPNNGRQLSGFTKPTSGFINSPGVGAYNDPDMLEVGNGNLTLDENKAHFTLWCMMASPLILGNDLRTFLKPDGSADTSNPVLQILTQQSAHRRRPGQKMYALPPRENQRALRRACKAFGKPAKSRCACSTKRRSRCIWKRRFPKLPV